MNAVQHILIFCVRVYRWVLSPAKLFLFGPSSGCRFTPSCSEYAVQALERHGVVKGSWLATRRVCRCHPWGGCGEDPVPDLMTPQMQPGALPSAERCAIQGCTTAGAVSQH